jgi:SAM-dependent methyltransferase
MANCTDPSRSSDGTSPGSQFRDVAPFYDHLMGRIPYRRWVDYVEDLLTRHGVRPRRVLDLACGTGRVGSEMLRRSYRACGVDLSEPMVRGCAARRPPLPAAVMDAANLGLRAESLDLVVCLYDSLNYVLEPEGLQRCFDRVQTALQSGGAFVFDLNAPRALQIGLFTQSNLESDDLLHYSWEAHWDEAAGLCRVEMLFRWRGDGAPVEFRETHVQRAYDEASVRTMLRRAGFATVDAYDAYTVRPTSRWTDRIYFVALKA